MKQLPVLNAKEIEKQELLERIDLTKRPTITYNMGQLDAVAARLAARDFDRQRFIEDPRSYLSEQRIPVPSCKLVVERIVQTTEVAIANLVAVVNIFFGVNIQVGLNLQAYSNVQAVTNCYNATSGCNTSSPHLSGVENHYYHSPVNFGFINTL